MAYTSSVSVGERDTIRTGLAGSSTAPLAAWIVAGNPAEGDGAALAFDPRAHIVVKRLLFVTQLGRAIHQVLEIGRRAAMQAEREAIERVLAQTRWNRRQAAKILKISYKALLNKLKAMEEQQAKAKAKHEEIQ